MNGRPFLAYLLDQVARFGFRDVVLCVGWQAEAVEAALGRAHGPLRLRYSRESEPLGTGGALRLALPLLDAPAVMVLNGDSYCDADLAAAWAEHRERRASATLVLVEMADTSRYGRVEIDAGGADLPLHGEAGRQHTGLDQRGNLSARARAHRNHSVRAARSPWSATCCRAGSGRGSGAIAAGPVSLISEPLNRILLRPDSSGRKAGPPSDHQPHALPHLLLRGRHRLSGLVPRARRRRARHRDRQVLLPDCALPAALLRAPLPRGLLEDRRLPRDRRDPASRRPRDPALPRLRARRRDPPRRRSARAQRHRLFVVVLCRIAARALRAERQDAEQAPARRRRHPHRAGPC